MKKVRVEDALGQVLCHDVTAMYDGFKGPAFKRGHVITIEDIPRLLDYGKTHVFVWEDIENEIHEDDVALALANMCKVANAHMVGPSEGKIVWVADDKGMWCVDTELLHKINAIGDITITTLPNHYRVLEGDTLASMRIVPLTTQKYQIEKAKELCETTALYRLLAYKHKNVGVIITGSEIYNGRIKDKFETVCRKKMADFPCTILDVIICDDDLEMIKESAKSLEQKGADVIICSGGMSVDPDDLTPTAIRGMGADIVSYGVPAQPGNMTLVAYKKDIAYLGVPGAAISMPTTIFDVVLPQIFTGIKFTKEELLNLANGGLCQKCKVCHYPNCTFGRY